MGFPGLRVVHSSWQWFSDCPGSLHRALNVLTQNVLRFYYQCIMGVAALTVEHRSQIGFYIAIVPEGGSVLHELSYWAAARDELSVVFLFS